MTLFAEGGRKGQKEQWEGIERLGRRQFEVIMK